MKTETPRTDAVFNIVAGISRCQSDLQQERRLRDLSMELERELAASKEEVKEIRAALGDDGRRTHKEILEMAFKASGWKLWKEKYIDLRNAHIAEGQDPAGTIWEHADKLQKELKETKAEVERLKEQLESTKLLALKFWKVLEENGFKIELPK
jgi:F0F1-type ATP synthase membrane subunit b/b'